MDDDQLDRLLAAANPVERRQRAVPPPAELDRILERAERRRRRRRLKLALPLIPVIAGAATAGALALRPSPAADVLSLQVSCATDLTLDKTFTRQAVSPDPVSDCAQAWASGLVIANRRTVPPLTACVLDGAVRVYPAADACNIVNLPAFAGYSGTQLAALTLNETLQRFSQAGPACRSASEISSFVNSQLSLLRLTGWRVVVRSDPACKGIVVALARRTVFVG